MAAFDKSISCRLAPAPGEGQRAGTVTHARIANLFCYAVHPAGWFAPECVLRLVLVCSGGESSPRDHSRSGRRPFSRFAAPPLVAERSHDPVDRDRKSVV